MTKIHSFFETHGYYLARGIFTQEEIRMLEEDFDRIVSQITASRQEEANVRWQGPHMERLGAMQTAVLHTNNVQIYSARWLQAIQKDAFLKVAEAILGPDIVLHHTKLFQKPAEKGAPFPMHQDWSYFPSVKDTMIAAIIHVSESTDEMGCLRVVPGSHKLGRLPGTSGQVASEILEKHPLESAVPLEAGPGDVAFFHYFTLHGSKPNRSSKIRKTVLAQMHAGHDRIEEGITHPNVRLALRGWNHAATRSLASQA